MDRLIEILKKELDIYKKILDVSKNKTDLLKGNKVKELEATTKEEEELVSNVVAEEKVRIQIIKELCRNHGVPEKTLKIEEICEFEEAPKEELMELKKEIVEILDELKEVNKINTVLIKSSLEYVNFAVNMLTESNKNTLYQAGGIQENKPQRNFFDMKL